MLSPVTQQKIKNFVTGVFNLDDTPITEEELKAEVEAAKKKADQEKSREGLTSRRENRGGEGRGGAGIGGGAGGGGGFGGGGGRKGVITIEEDILPARSGGRIRAMQAGGMTAPNPYGAAVGEDYNFGFSGGGAMPTEYLAGGKLLEGPGDGMSDDIPAVIRGKGVQRAALADGEFVVPADVVSHLGNGSTKAGAKKLYTMMNRIRQARTGKSKQAPEVEADKYMPA
jgi:hypothetical protein